MDGCPGRICCCGATSSLRRSSVATGEKTSRTAALRPCGGRRAVRTALLAMATSWWRNKPAGGRRGRWGSDSAERRPRHWHWKQKRSSSRPVSYCRKTSLGKAVESWASKKMSRHKVMPDIWDLQRSGRGLGNKKKVLDSAGRSTE